MGAGEVSFELVRTGGMGREVFVFYYHTENRFYVFIKFSKFKVMCVWWCLGGVGVGVGLRDDEGFFFVCFFMRQYWSWLSGD